MATVETPRRAPKRAAAAPRQRKEQSRARYPDRTGFIERDGVRSAWEVYGAGDPAILFLPTWSIIHSRTWKSQIPWFARRHRVVTFDGRGNGRSNRPAAAEAYAIREFADDALAVLDATATDAAFLVGFSHGAQTALILAAEHPERVRGLVLIAPAVPTAPSMPRPEARAMFDRPLDRYDGWDRWNRRYWLAEYPEFLEFFFGRVFTEAHSTKQIEDCVGWGLETTAETLVSTILGRPIWDDAELRAIVDRVECPVVVVHGTDDDVRPHASGAALAEMTGGRLVTLEGSGHAPHARDPVKVNLLLRDIVGPPAPSRWTRGMSRGRRALYISSPIGLGHAQRDLAIAAELRKLQPDLQIEWLAQHPVTSVLGQHGERIHPASEGLASESGHIASESSGHELNAFQAIRRMDEILVANYMVFHEVVEHGGYDLVIGDEAWDVDYYLHENPELKRTAYAWLTDFVGWLPMPDGGEREAFLTADYNAEMIEHIARFPRLRDRAIFVGGPEDVVPDSFGPGLPLIRDWMADHYDFAGYVTGFDPAPLIAGREEIRRELGYRPDERIVLVTVGGSGVGESLLRRVVESYTDAARRVVGLRMVVVAGPRIDPATIDGPAGVDVRAFVPDLYRHLAACDLAVVQGGLTTTMELVAARRPFLYFPLENHFEQNRHVVHRLERYGAGRRMDFATATPEVLGDAIAAELDRPIDYRPVESDGAARAARLISELL
ncbi:MAG TPA: alpha/beta fold hydrolase [Candidatus Limnocylindrales bacterium]|nr:alpha/beta fold hydrolase [Candidatus Limnocylindrales bacterium]